MKNSKPKIIRACTVSNSIDFLLGMLDELIELYDLSVVSSPGKDWSCLDPWGDRVGRIEVSMERHIAPLKDLKSLWRLWRVFRHEKPTMVHSMTPKAGLLCMIAACIARVPVRVHTFTGLVFPTATGMKRRILMATDWLTCACATHIIPEGEGVKNDLLNHGITHKPIRVLGNGSCKGIDLEYFDRTPEVMASAAKIREDATFTFVYVGRLVHDKGINELIEAFEKINNEYPNTRLILVGRKEQELDPLEPHTLAKIENNKAINAVGTQLDVRPWLAASDALVFPSYREGFPNVVLEAGAMGLPSIVTDINGSREIIIEGYNGTIVPPRNAEALYNAMRAWVTEPSRPAAMALNSRTHIANHYDRKYVLECLTEYYHQIQ